jgi:hypothetical protein
VSGPDPFWAFTTWPKSPIPHRPGFWANPASLTPSLNPIWLHTTPSTSPFLQHKHPGPQEA